MVIEFVGLPGAGKSTVARAVKSHLVAAEYECTPSAPFPFVARPGGRNAVARVAWGLTDLSWAVRFTVKHAAVDRGPFAGAGGQHWRGRYWRLMRIWAAMVRLKHVSEGASDCRCCSVLDQGILQCLVSMYAHDRRGIDVQDAIGQWVGWMEDVLPDVTVFVEIDRETAVRRMRSRPIQKTTWDVESAGLSVALEPFEHIVREILPAALEGMHTRCVYVDGRDPLEASSRAVVGAMNAGSARE